MTTFVLSPDEPAVPTRAGDAPLTTHPSQEVPHPHQQLTQIAPVHLQDALVHRACSLPGVALSDSCISVPGARAFVLDQVLARGPRAAFQCSTEFAHIHPAGDGSLHIALPPGVYEEVRAKGWGEPHPISGTMLVFGPRDERELEIVWQILLTSYRFAVGDITVPGTSESSGGPSAVSSEEVV